MISKKNKKDCFKVSALSSLILINTSPYSPRKLNTRIRGKEKIHNIDRHPSSCWKTTRELGKENVASPGKRFHSAMKHEIVSIK